MPQLLATPVDRSPHGGIVLLTTLIGLMLLSSMVVTLQVRTQAAVQVLARLESRHVDAMATTAILRRLTARLDGNGPRPPLDGTVRQEIFAGRSFDVRLTDVEGLIDLYLAPEEVLALLPVPALQVIAMRESALATVPAGMRFLTINQTMARFGFDAATRQAIMPLVTQDARTGQINPALAPESIRAESRRTEAQDVASGQSATVAISRSPQP
ncbi:hypothetical protein SAMN05444339_101658 [Loktanella atrilutea]|uniref:General secretion pathway protein K n=1 Tax=Loktanella atrilutea TaxID=366533 RepID=A0A1M4UAE8_LOKAT|nr:hypothetical protein [Loktanella atrilutea]SHE53841.1 hypothetical protein SAMN05444339_101658 [Loktanella atrilutea]